MDGENQRIQALKQRGRGRIEIFVAYAEDATCQGRGGWLPRAAGDDFFQRHAIARAAPCGHDHFRVECGDVCEGNPAAGCAHEFSTGGFHQFSHPRLRSDQRFAPLLAEDSRARQSTGRGANIFDTALHRSDDFLTALARVGHARDGGNVGVDIGQRFGGQSEKACAGFQNLDDCLFLVGNGGDHKVGARGDDLLCIRSPGIGKNQAR